MTHVTLRPTISQTNQLIDLNKDLTNFRASFSVECPENKEFQFLVADQTTLDNENLEFENSVGGKAAGELNFQEDVYQNYFLVLRCNEPTEVEVNCYIEPKAPREYPGPGMTGHTGPTGPNGPMHAQETTFFSRNINWKLIGLVAVVAIVGYLAYSYFQNKDKLGSGVKKSSNSDNINKFIMNNSSPPTSMMSSGTTTPSSSTVSASPNSGNIMDKLNSLPLY